MLLKRIWVLVFSFMYLVSVDPMDTSLDPNSNKIISHEITFEISVINMYILRSSFTNHC